ncbi:hypothetical protein F2Q69_00006854 [Brassica cretica]|uniref:Arabidopsis retrotransposon Orf1 C-terminal domain-containing protein n=1 Tax=Brassica cretica TaxID=69181 RepID=A0A8S9PK13_BRACR|nr:hypothetical protein F2Q69_00006854 [Brassica cretica]
MRYRSTTIGHIDRFSQRHVDRHRDISTDERRTKRRFDTNSPAPDTRKAVKSLACRNRAIEDAWDDYDNIFYNAWLKFSIEPTLFVDPGVARALGIRSDHEDLFVELGMGNFATHPQVLYLELVRQFKATVNIYYANESAKKGSEGVLTFFIRSIRYKVPLLTLCTIYRFETERQQPSRTATRSSALEDPSRISPRTHYRLSLLCQTCLHVLRETSSAS